MEADELKQKSMVYLVDDDADVLESLEYLVNIGGFQCRAYSDPRELLKERFEESPACIVMDLAMPSLSGLELLRLLKAKQCDKPVLMLTSRGSVASAVEAMKLGASEFLEKPIEHERLLEIIEKMLQQDADNNQVSNEASQFRAKFASLTPREKEIVEMISTGLPTKTIAARLSLSIKTIEVHRSHISRKFGARSMANLMLMLAKAGIVESHVT